jgi:hypothetical protein
VARTASTRDWRAGLDLRATGRIGGGARGKALSAEGRDFIALPSVVAEEALRRYQFRILGTAETCRVQSHAITAERLLAHPAVALIVEKTAWQRGLCHHDRLRLQQAGVPRFVRLRCVEGHTPPAQSVLTR